MYIKLAAILICFANVAFAEMVCETKGQVTNCQSKGNLAPTQNQGCITLEQATPTLSPADLALRVAACSKKARYQDAAELYILLQMRGYFDMDRVADKTAHQAISVMKIEIANFIGKRATAKLKQAALDLISDTNAPQFVTLCQKLRALGVPKHDPTYMINHGMGAILGEGGKKIVNNFNAKSAWDRARNSLCKPAK